MFFSTKSPLLKAIEKFQKRQTVPWQTKDASVDNSKISVPIENKQLNEKNRFLCCVQFLNKRRPQISAALGVPNTWRVKSSGVRQSKIYKWPLVVKGLMAKRSVALTFLMQARLHSMSNDSSYAHNTERGGN